MSLEVGLGVSPDDDDCLAVIYNITAAYSTTAGQNHLTSRLLRPIDIRNDSEYCKPDLT